jgi:regulator of sigma E protease
MIPFGPKPIPEHRFLEGRPLYARLLIMSGGVIMNMVLAYLVFTGMQLGYGKPILPPVVDSLQAGMPAERAGLKAGDSVVAVNGTPVTSWTDMVRIIRAEPGKDITFDIRRQGQPLSLVVQAASTIDSTTGGHQVVGQVGVWAPRDRGIRERVPIGTAFAEAWRVTAVVSVGTVDVVVGLVRRQVPLSAVGGPVQIAKDSVAAARNGFEELLFLLAVLSINLAVFNLLPIPILDGGQILLVLAERAKGKPFSMRTRENILRIGLVAILLIICLVMFNDLGMRKFFG